MRLIAICVLVIISYSIFAQSISERDYHAYFDEYELKGSFLLLDAQTNQFTAYNLARCRQGFLPASTFKIPNTVIALETGVVRDTNQLFTWDRVQRTRPEWNRNLTLSQALRTSAFWCYQIIAREVGTDRYHKLLAKLRYGHMIVTPSTLDMFWLSGSSRINSFEQIDFLQRLQQQKLEVSVRSQELTKSLLTLSKEKSSILYGKGGWSVTGNYNNGWFVGWVENAGKFYFYALNVEPKEEGTLPSGFSQNRRTLVEKLLKYEFKLL